MSDKITGSFVNSSGRAFAIEGISPLLPEKIRAAVAAEWEVAGRALPPMPKPPAYEVENAAGEKSPHAHDETTLVTDEDKAAWASYQQKLSDYRLIESLFEAEINKRILRAVCLCVKVNDADYTDWIDEQEVLGIPLPEKNAEKRISFVETNVIRSTEDILRLMTAVMKLAGIADDRMAEAAEKSFRAAMDEAVEGAIAGGPGDNAG